MKKKLEAELISIAHRVLKLKNRSETKQLQEEAKKLYEQLTVLRFYEENFEAVKEEIPVEVLEAKLQEEAAVDLEVQEEEPILKEESTFEPEIEEEIIEEEVETIQHEEDIKEQPALFDNVSIDDFKELDFVKVEDVPKEVERVAETTFEKVEEVEEPVVEEEEVVEAVEETTEEVKEEIVIEKVPEVVFEEPKVKSLNDRLNNGINIGLNDRIAFEKKLFGGSADDFNRVLSQLNTFESFDEAKGFIEDFVKPDYNNWDGKEEFENRFLEFVERKFS